MNSKNVSTMKKLLLSLLMFVSCNMMFSQNEFEYVAGCEYSDIIDYYDILFFMMVRILGNCFALVISCILCQLPACLSAAELGF